MDTPLTTVSPPLTTVGILPLQQGAVKIPLHGAAGHAPQAHSRDGPAGDLLAGGAPPAAPRAALHAVGGGGGVQGQEVGRRGAPHEAGHQVVAAGVAMGDEGQVEDLQGLQC